MSIETFRYRDVSIYAKGYAKEWNSHTVFDIKWDANRDPEQKFSVTFKTNTSDIVDGEQFLGLLVIEFPGRIVNIDLHLKYIGEVDNICIKKRLNLLVPYHNSVFALIRG